MPRIVIASMAYGSGHMMAGRALSEAFERLSPDAEVQVMDGILDTPSPLERFTASFYIFTNKRAHWLWRTMYYASPFRSRLASWLAEWFFSREDSRALLATQPDAVVSTHFWSTKVAARNGLTVFTVITDYVYHPFWLSRKTHAYFVASEEIRDNLIAGGISPERIRITGIPVRRRFWNPPEQKEARNKLGISEDDRVVLLMAGNHGVTPVMDIADRLKSHDICVIMTAGRNRNLEERMRDFVKKHGVRGKVLGFVEDMEDLLSACDIVVTKAGGIISSECLAVGTPVVFFDSLPGQEEGNARVISEWGAGVRAQGPDSAAELVIDILQDPGKLEAMRSAAAKHSRPRASLDIAKEVLGWLE